jgi:cytochrome P450
MKNSILASKSDEKWALKRKILTQSFYKEKLMKLVTIMIKLADKKTNEWKEEFADKPNS